MLGVFDRFEKIMTASDKYYVEARDKSDDIEIVYSEPEDYFPKEIRDEFFPETVEGD